MRKTSNDSYVAKMDLDGSEEHRGPSTSRPAWQRQEPTLEEIDSD